MPRVIERFDIVRKSVYMIASGELSMCYRHQISTSFFRYDGFRHDRAFSISMPKTIAIAEASFKLLLRVFWRERYRRRDGC